MSNVGGSAGEGGFDFQARLIAFISIHILAETVLAELGRELEGIPIAVSAETNGPGDDIQIEFLDNVNLIEIQAKKGLRVDARFTKTLEKIASGLVLHPSLNVILAVDPKTTKRIRENLPHDLKRLRQGREDIPQDRELLDLALKTFKKYATSNEHARELLRRLFVVAFDIEKDRSRDRSQALTLLQNRVLSEKEQVNAAWDILVYEGHQLIGERGRRVSTDLARLLQSRNVQLASSLSPVLKDRYQQWLMTNTSTFSIPGPTLGKPLPIETTWIDLQVLPRQHDQPPQSLEAQLATYDEREKLAERDDAYSALDIAKIEHRVVILGSPGAGKSTLCRKLAYDLTMLEEQVLWVRLSEIANYLDNGLTIDEALTAAATSVFPLSKHSRALLFKQVDCLIADGLDESGSNLMRIAEDLQQWASAHPDTRIVITTRSTGYDPRFFSNWEHQELLPLSENQIKKYAYQIIAALNDDLSLLDQQFKQFQTYLRQSRTVSLASRNPLLLGFLIQLSLAGTHPATNRAGLYEQIIDLWYMAFLRDRKAKLTDLDLWPIQRSFEIIGWFLLQTDDPKELSRKHLALQVANHFTQELDINQPIAQIRAEKCLQFWQERGVLEMLQFMHESTVIFIHPTLGEYAAARYFVKLDHSSTQTWVRNKHNDPRWREPLLFASGLGGADPIVAALLDIDTASDTDSAALLLAATALAESKVYSHELASTVIERLKTLLTSPSSSIAYEAAEHASDFATQTPELFHAPLYPLLQHPQEWTRISAMYLLLVGDDPSADLGILERLLDELSKSDQETQGSQGGITEAGDTTTAAAIREKLLFFSDGWAVQNKVIVRGAEVLARLRPNIATKSLLQALYLSSNISYKTHQNLADILIALGCQEFVQQNTSGLSERNWINWFRETLLADLRMLETILSVTKFTFILPKKLRKLLNLTTLIYALNVPKSGVSDWNILRRLDDIQSIEAVLLGFIQAYSIPMKELALDTMWALNEIQQAVQDDAWNISLLDLLLHIPVKLDTPKGVNIDVPTEDLVRALKHPSGIIARGALYILFLSQQKEELRTLLKDQDEKIIQFIEKFSD
jgi:hypothetical protein